MKLIAIIAALALSVQAQDTADLNCKFPNTWEPFHAELATAWNSLRAGVLPLKNVGLYANYGIRKDGTKSPVKVLGQLRMAKRDDDEDSHLEKRALVPGSDSHKLARYAICTIIKAQVPELSCLNMAC
jgi:hypothetical protein